MQQVIKLHPKFDSLQEIYGASALCSIYGAGEINSPKLMFIFMNPTGRNVASSLAWKGIRAPWLGTKQIWSMFCELGLISLETHKQINSKKTVEWDEELAARIYRELERNSVYVTNLAKCTQIDARPLANKVFKQYLDLIYQEIEIVKPQRIITFGNQVSSIILEKEISVSKYLQTEFEEITIGGKFRVFPTYYPVGQGRRNQPLAVARIKKLLADFD